MRPAIVKLAIVTAALAHPASAAPAFAQAKDEGWVVGSFGSEGSRQCLAMGLGETRADALIASVGELGVIEFYFTSERLNLTEGQHLPAELLVDGQKVELADVVFVNARVVQLVGVAKGRLEGSILRAVEGGKRATLRLLEIRDTFSLDGSRQSLERLSQCVMNGGRISKADEPASNSAPPKGEPADDEPRADAAAQAVGNWVIYPSAPYIPGGCFAARINNEGSTFFLHQERPQTGITFGIGSKGFNLSNGWRRPAELILDGQPIPFFGMRTFDKATLISSEAMDAKIFHARLREARHGAFTFEGKTFEFDLSGFAAAIPAFARCVAANDKTFASVMDGNRVNQALGVTLPPEEATGTTSNKASDVEEKEETDAPASMGSLLNRPRAFAQLRCSIPMIHMVGLYGANTGLFVFDISVNADATANVSGTTITPIDHSMNASGPSTAIYRASTIYGAANKFPMGDKIVKNMPRPPQDEFEKAMMGMLSNPGSIVPENRYIAVSLDNNDATVADQTPGGGFGEMTTHRCRRIR